MRSFSVFQRFDAVLKRGLDIVLAGTTLAILVPTTPLLALAIRLESEGPVFFKCRRLGLDGRPMTIWKFRTMRHNAPEKFQADGSRLVEQDDPRVTKVGAFLRGGIDELPQTLNILRGELSFVGPRPDDLFAIDMYCGSDWLKLAITPGLTGLAQVNGRNELPYRDRLKYDAYYALHRDLWLDLRIIVRTLGQAAGWQPSTALVEWEEVERVAAGREARALAEEIERRIRTGAGYEQT